MSIGEYTTQMWGDTQIQHFIKFLSSVCVTHQDGQIGKKKKKQDRKGRNPSLALGYLSETQHEQLHTAGNGPSLVGEQKADMETKIEKSMNDLFTQLWPTYNQFDISFLFLARSH
jgi:hypothetical protein